MLVISSMQHSHTSCVQYQNMIHKLPQSKIKNNKVDLLWTIKNEKIDPSFSQNCQDLISNISNHQ